MLYYINTCAQDARLLALCAGRIRTLDADATIVLANDPEHPVPRAQIPHGCKILQADTTPRNGTLNGLPFVRQQLKNFATVMQAEQQTALVKIDCDTWLNSTDWLTDTAPEADFMSIERATPGMPSGAVYRITQRGAEAALAALDARPWQTNWYYPEDQTTYYLCTSAGMKTHLIPYPEGRGVGMHADLPTARETNAYAVHCGEPCADGTRAPRDFAHLRMLCLAQVCPTPPQN